MNQTSNKVKCILVAGMTVYFAYCMGAGAVDMGQNIKLQQGFGAVLTGGLQAVMWLGVFVLSLTAFQNLLELFVLCMYEDRDQIHENARKLIRFTIYLKIFASLAMRLIFSLLFIVLACVALFAPGVKNRDSGVYGAAVFMLVVAGVMAFANIRVAVARVREMQGEKRE